MKIRDTKGFTPLESPGIYCGDEKYKNLIPFRKNGIKASPFLTGFTILETLMVTAILSFLVLLIYGTLESGNRLCTTTDAIANNLFEAKRALLDMEREIRGGDDFTFSPKRRPYNAMSFTLGTQSIAYNLKYDKTTKKYYLEKTASGESPKRLANNIESIEFTPEPSPNNPNKVIITMNLEKTTKNNRNINLGLTQEIKVRNS